MRMGGSAPESKRLHRGVAMEPLCLPLESTSQGSGLRSRPSLLLLGPKARWNQECATQYRSRVRSEDCRGAGIFTTRTDVGEANRKTEAARTMPIVKRFLEALERWAEASPPVLAGRDLSGADLGGANLSGIDLRGANLTAANLVGSQLDGADLRGAVLSGTYLTLARLRGADLRDAHLHGADLDGADLRDADLRGAILDNTGLDGAIVSGTRWDR